MNKIPKILFLQHFANIDKIAQIVCLCFNKPIVFHFIEIAFFADQWIQKATQKCLYQLFNKLYSYRIRKETEFIKISVFSYLIDEPEFCMEKIEIIATG
jgi:hypothetical protein